MTLATNTNNYNVHIAIQHRTFNQYMNASIT